MDVRYTVRGTDSPDSHRGLILFCWNWPDDPGALLQSVVRGERDGAK